MDCAYFFVNELQNGKSKISQAAKAVQASHRLILSGTPIQNNVLELWSLFDFLMPGFLGTERQFNQLYGKPILASRDAKASSKEHEAGTLALEALHRQVLPFLLRRVKEDVLDDLPPKIIQDYYCDLSPLQLSLYESIGRGTGPDAVQGGKQHIFQALQFLRRVCSHPALVITPQHPQYPRVTKMLEQQGSSLRDVQVYARCLGWPIFVTCGLTFVLA